MSVLQATDGCALSIKSAWNFDGLTFKRPLGETMPLKYGVYNQSFSFALLLYSALSDIPKHPTKPAELRW